jgi:hypothetical protein
VKFGDRQSWPASIGCASFGEHLADLRRREKREMEGKPPPRILPATGFRGNGARLKRLAGVAIRLHYEMWSAHSAK